MIDFAPSGHKHLLPPWAIRLGIPGLFLVSAIDASIIPLAVPGTTDLLLLWLVSHGGNPWFLASSAVAGSLVGGTITWGIGKKGGERALERWIPDRIHKRVVGWVQRHPAWSVFIPPMLPPPIPLAPFLLAAGAMGVPRRSFLTAFGIARALRYGLVAWLALIYGRRLIHLWAGTLEKWASPVPWAFALIVLAGFCFSLFKLRSQKKPTTKAPVHQAETGIE